jgi:uncharacterized membrane protein
VATNDKKKTSSRSKKSIQSEIESNVLKVIELEKKQKESRTFGERISEWIALFAGSMFFVYIHVVWFGGWILANTVAPIEPFDPFPFTFLTLVVSLEAIFLSTFILISQNHETRLTNRRNHLDLQINLLAEQENTKTLELLEAIAKKVGVDLTDESIEALLEPAEPETLLKQIREAED